jgi:hypothetical protein
MSCSTFGFAQGPTRDCRGRSHPPELHRDCRGSCNIPIKRFGFRAPTPIFKHGFGPLGSRRPGLRMDLDGFSMEFEVWLGSPWGLTPARTLGDAPRFVGSQREGMPETPWRLRGSGAPRRTQPNFKASFCLKVCFQPKF